MKKLEEVQGVVFHISAKKEYKLEEEVGTKGIDRKESDRHSNSDPSHGE